MCSAVLARGAAFLQRWHRWIHHGLAPCQLIDVSAPALLCRAVLCCSGYTAKVAGTEMGVTEPEATFSACFGSAFLMWHPTKSVQCPPGGSPPCLAGAMHPASPARLGMLLPVLSSPSEHRLLWPASWCPPSGPRACLRASQPASQPCRAQQQAAVSPVSLHASPSCPLCQAACIRSPPRQAFSSHLPAASAAFQGLDAVSRPAL
jgi:hypothetical protein